MYFWGVTKLSDGRMCPHDIMIQCTVHARRKHAHKDLQKHYEDHAAGLTNPVSEGKRCFNSHWNGVDQITKKT